MSFRVAGLCRGDGKGYINIVTQGDRYLWFEACASTPSGADIPCGVYELPVPGDDRNVSRHAGVAVQSGSDERQCIVTVPLLDNITLNIRLFGVDAAGTSTELGRLRFNPLRSKITSRLTYRYKPSVAWKMRGIDQIRLSGQPYIYVTGIYPLGNEEIICRFHATVPYNSDDSYEVTLIDVDGIRLDYRPVLLEDNVVPDRRDMQNMLHEMTYSVVLPASMNTFCIAMHKNNGRSGEGCFTCLLPANSQSFLTAAIDGLKHASQDARYPEWFAKHRATPADIIRQKTIIDNWNNTPLISIVTPVYRPAPEYLRAMIDSVLAQSYKQFELVLVNASGECSDIDEVLAEYDDSRIRIISVENQGISTNTNVGIDHCNGDYIAFVDHDDTIEPDALYRYMSVIQRHPETDVMYCDEDHLKTDHYEWPTFKPAYNPDLLYSHNYVTHMLMVSRYVLNQVERSQPEVDGAQDYDLTLKCCEKARSIRNVPYVLYHWREHEQSTSSDMSSKPYAVTAGRKALQSHFDRCGIPAVVEERELACTYKVRYETNAKVSIIIPTKDHAQMLKTCIDSILNRTTYDNYEIICVENNSIEEETFSYYRKIRKDPRIKVITWNQGFNYSAICNFGASKACGDLLLFLNNDTEVISPDWLTSMAGFFTRNDVGVVGAKLYNYDGLIQHGGIWAVPGGCFYINQNFTKFDNGYMNLLKLPSNCAAVTGACQMISKSVFELVGGFDEELAVSFSDIDICLKADKLGYRTVFVPDANLYHRESSSRGSDELDPEKQRRMEHEKFLYFNKWSNLERGRFMNINLDQYDGHFKIAH